MLLADQLCQTNFIYILKHKRICLTYYDYEHVCIYLTLQPLQGEHRIKVKVIVANQADQSIIESSAVDLETWLAMLVHHFHRRNHSSCTTSSLVHCRQQHEHIDHLCLQKFHKPSLSI